MKRDMELIREILLEIENLDSTPTDWLDDFAIEGHSAEVVSYHVWLLDQVGLVVGMDASTMDEFDFKPRCLTWHGFEYLENIRNPEIWQNTKESANKVGSFSLDVLTAIAKGYIKKKVKDMSDIDIDI